MARDEKSTVRDELNVTLTVPLRRLKIMTVDKMIYNDKPVML